MKEDFVQCRVGALNLTDDEVEIIALSALRQLMAHLRTVARQTQLFESREFGMNLKKKIWDTHKQGCSKPIPNQI